MTAETLHTKWGTAKISPNKEYYAITSRKEGNNRKLLHRLIFEEFYGEIPKGFHIHHKNGNKKDNCILNLQLIRNSDHISLHTKGKLNPFYGKTHSFETKQKLSESNKGEKSYWYGKHHSNQSREKISKNLSKKVNTTGVYRVSKMKVNDCTQGFRFRYVYPENGKFKSITSVSIDKLKEKVLNKGLEWIEYNRGM